MTAITNYITNDFKPLDSHETIEGVKAFFVQKTFSHFPVVDEEIYIGCVSALDVDTFENTEQLLHYRHTFEGFYARTNMIWLDVLQLFSRNETNLVPILDQNNIYVGYYEIVDIIKLFNETPFLKEEGGIIVVEKGALDYSIGQIVQIVETNNGRVLGLFVSETSVDTVKVTLKIALGSMNEIIQTFRRYNYEIISEHQEDTYLKNLKERSDYLDKYLNI